MLEPVTVPCLECGVELAGDSPELRRELTCDNEPFVFCPECWEREFGENAARFPALRGQARSSSRASTEAPVKEREQERCDDD